MEATFADDELDRLEVDADFTAGLSPALVKAFRKALWAIRAAHDERDFYQRKAARFEKLSGKRDHQYSMRLNDQFRLIIEFVGAGRDKTVRVIEIEDYH